MSELLCIEKNSENVLIIEKSKFFSFSFKVFNELEVENILASLSNKFNDATHICYAYDLINKQKCFDDGEPQGTSGKPILDCIQKKKLKNVLVVVVRYFGGIKLGAGGLVRAYSNSASLVLNKSGINVLKQCVKFNFQLLSTEIKKLAILKQLQDIKQIDVNYGEKIIVSVIVEHEKFNEFQTQLENIFCKKMQLQNIEQIYS